MVKRKGQEEMVGLVVIMLIVAVIFLVFLGISIGNKDDTNQKSSEVTDFLASIDFITSECSLNGYKYLALNELFEYCNKGSLCIGGKKACEVLETELKEVIERSWNFNEASNTKGYKFEAFLESEQGVKSPIPLKGLEKGSCTENLRGDDRIKPLRDGDKIIYSLILC